MLISLNVDKPYPTEFRVTGDEGSMVVFDSRLWHCPPGNDSDQFRVAVGVRYAPWCLNLEVLDPNSDYRRQIVNDPGKTENSVPRVTRQAYESLPEKFKPLFRHWLERQDGGRV